VFLDHKGNFQKPFYHGTTTLFLDSIRETGLGARNWVKKYGWHDVFVDLFNLGDQLLSDDTHWKAERNNLIPIAHQQNTKDGLDFNFSHGEVYITPIRSVAEKYAKIKCGCELLEYIFIVFYILREKGFLKEAMALVPENVMALYNQPYKPVIILINGLRWRDIVTETGFDKETLLQEYEEYFSSGKIRNEIPAWKLTTQCPASRLVIDDL
jgi:hypothetical protein